MSEQAEVTQWFSGNTRPKKVGVYQRRYGQHESDFGYAMWDGSVWLCYMPTKEHAALQDRDCGDVSLNQAGLPWRGLASDPKAKP